MTTIYDADILLVDDNPDLLALVADNLHTAGYKTVRTAASCADAKTAFARRRPELMILDINLPGVTTRGRTGSPGSAMMCAHRWR